MCKNNDVVTDPYSPEKTTGTWLHPHVYLLAIPTWFTRFSQMGPLDTEINHWKDWIDPPYQWKLRHYLTRMSENITGDACTTLIPHDLLRVMFDRLMSLVKQARQWEDRLEGFLYVEKLFVDALTEQFHEKDRMKCCVAKLRPR